MVIVYHEDLLKHSQWSDHPESPFRLKTIRKKLENEGLWDVIPPHPIDDELVLKIHTADLLKKLKSGEEMPIDPDTMLRKDTYDMAMLSASLAVEAVKHALNGEPSIALSRPPGHHAGKSRMGGFCYLNNAAIAAQSANVRTMIIDLDVHHCNGTEEIFYDRKDVMVVSLHEADFYWDSGYLEDIGEGAGTGYNVNVPIPRGSGNNTYNIAMDEIVIPLIGDFKPELLIICLGVDGHYGDTNSHMVLNTQGYIGLCKKLYDAAPDKKIAFILEGGYHLRATAEVVAGVAALFQDREIKPEYGEEKVEQSNGPREMRKAKEFIFSERERNCD